VMSVRADRSIGRSRALGLTAISLGFLMITLDATIVNVALGPIGARPTPKFDHPRSETLTPMTPRSSAMAGCLTSLPRYGCLPRRPGRRGRASEVSMAPDASASRPARAP
jgi:hypothetical protein